MTYEDYVLLPDDGKIHEIIDGDHYMTPAPETYHQTVSRKIQFQLYEQIEEEGLGFVFDAPTDVQLSETDIVQPDILVILAERKSIISPKKVIGPPDLIIEILSEHTSQKDMTLKYHLYQQTSVPEYWIVDPIAQSVRMFVMQNERYAERGSFHGEIGYNRIPGVKVDLSKVW